MTQQAQPPAGAPQRLFGLAPIVDARTRLLVLGSFPGAAAEDQKKRFHRLAAL